MASFRSLTFNISFAVCGHDLLVTSIVVSVYSEFGIFRYAFIAEKFKASIPRCRLHYIDHDPLHAGISSSARRTRPKCRDTFLSRPRWLRTSRLSRFVPERQSPPRQPDRLSFGWSFEAQKYGSVTEATTYVFSSVTATTGALKRCFIVRPSLSLMAALGSARFCPPISGRHAERHPLSDI